MTRAEKKAAYKGPKYLVPKGDPGRPCRGCGRTIHWVKTASGADMPVEYDGIPHWGFCPNAGDFKR